VNALDSADRDFAQGDYDAAARSYEDYLKQVPSGGQRDQALYRLGLTYALRTNSGPDWRRASAAFRQLTEEYPMSALKSSANLILSLRSEIDQLTADKQQRDQRIRQLTGELDRLKSIDAERRKRP
jgi:TolA-binding protein